MPPPLAPWLLVATLAGTAGPERPLLMEPSYETDYALITTARPLLGCVYWFQRSTQPQWVIPTSPTGGGAHALPLPQFTAELPAWYEAACYNAAGWGPKMQGVVRLTDVWAVQPQ